MAKMGLRKFEELVGRSDLLDARPGVEHWKARGLDFSRIFYRPAVEPGVAIRQCEIQNHGLEKALDHELIARAAATLSSKKPVSIESRIFNRNRTVGAMLSGE